MSRPDHIPVCRIQCLPLSGNGTTHWRRARHGAYGAVTLDSRGRQCVALAAVEQAVGQVFTEAEIERALRTPSRHVTHDRQRAERLRELWPGDFRIPERPLGYMGRDGEDAFVRGCIQSRDKMWIAYLRAVGAHI